MKKLVLLFFACCIGCFVPFSSYSQVTVAPFTNARVTFLTNTNGVAAGYCLFTFQAGTTTQQATYSDLGVTLNANPVILDGTGSASIYLQMAAYKFQLKSAGGVNCATGSVIWTQDNVNPSTPLSAFVGLVSTGAVTVTSPTAATSGANQSGPNTCFDGNYWTGSASAVDSWCWFDSLGTGANPTSSLILTHSGSSGTSNLSLPASTLASATVTGALTAKTIETTRYADQFAGVDIGAQVNAAYADCPATGCEIVIPPQASGCYTYTTPIVFNTVGKAVKLRGAPGRVTCINFTPNSGIAVLLDYSSNLRPSGISGIQILSSGPSQSVTCLELGLTNAVLGAVIDGVVIGSAPDGSSGGCSTGIKYGNSASFGNTIRESIIQNSTVCIDTTVASAESSRIIDSFIDHCATGVSVNGGDLYIHGSSLDDNTVNLAFGVNGGVLHCNGCHFENIGLGARMNVGTIPNAAVLQLSGGIIQEDFTTGTTAQLISATGNGVVMIHGTDILSNGATITQVVNFAGTSTGNLQPTLFNNTILADYNTSYTGGTVYDCILNRNTTSGGCSYTGGGGFISPICLKTGPGLNCVNITLGSNPGSPFSFTVPTPTANDTFASLGTVQTFTAIKTFQGAASGSTAFAILPCAACNAISVQPTNPGAARNLKLFLGDPGADVVWGTSLNTGSAVYQTKRGVAGCTTGAAAGNSCASDITITWTTAFLDANYTVSCMGNAPTNVPSNPFIVSGTKLAATVHVNYFAITAAAASFATVECTAVHD